MLLWQRVVLCMRKGAWAHELSQMQKQVAFATGASRGCTKLKREEDRVNKQ